MTKATRFANRQVAEKMRSLRESWERSGSDLDWLELLQAKYRVGGLSKADMADVFVFLDELRTQLTEAKAEMRERCAMVAESEGVRIIAVHEDNDEARRIAAAIRALPLEGT